MLHSILGMLAVLLACTVALAAEETSTDGRRVLGYSTSDSTTQTFAPVADARVDASKPRTNFGASKSLGTDARPRVRSYLRFRLPENIGTVQEAELLLWARTSSTAGFAVRRVAKNDWREMRITYANAPTPSSIVTGTSGSLAAREWASVDVSSLVKGGGTYSLALTTTNRTAINLASRESAASYRPMLVVTPVNDAPVASDDAEYVAEDGQVVFDPTGNDSPGPSDEAGQELGPPTIRVAPSHGTATVPSNGPDAGKVRYIPSLNYNGSDSFTYEICEVGSDAHCDTATVSLTVSRVVPTVETTHVQHSGDAAD